MQWFALGATVVLLDASLTFENLWPTPAITWHGRLSVELAVGVLALLLVSRASGPLSRRAVAWVSAVWTLFVLGRYAEVTAPALYGRDVNLYWDLRFIPDVVSMVTRVAPVWIVALCVGAAALVLTALYGLLRWSLRRVSTAMADPRARRALAVPSVAATIWYVALQVNADVPGELAFAAPVTRTYARQLRFVAEAMTGSTSLAESPAMDADLSGITGADVFVVFVESYGAVAFQRPEIAGPLAASRRELDTAIRETHRDVVSAYVESPTFGGNSWLAHLSLMSGIEVRDPETNAKLMTAQRDTLARAFSRRGFRTIALMPGLRQKWPEGSFYGFDEIYGADRLDYWGPEFGWFAIPDQYSLQRLDALEVNRSSRPPLFVFFPTISTHFPFSPTPPYQPNWPRMTDRHPYEGPDIVRAYARQPDWTDFAPGYVDAMAYDFASIGGFLRLRPERDSVMILLGDHQPPAVVTGEGAPWDVPVHVIASRKPVLDRLVAHGFRQGLTPERPAIARMHALVPVLLDAFSDGR